MFLQKIAVVMAAEMVMASVQPSGNIAEYFADNDSIKVYSSVAEDYSCMISGEQCDIRRLSSSDYGSLDKYTLYLVDVSASANQVMQETSRDILNELIDGQDKNCKSAIATFSSDFIMHGDYTSDRYELSKTAKEIEFTKNNTNLYTSIKSAAENIISVCGNSYGRVIVISDGVDVNKNGLTYYELESYLDSAHIQVFTVGIESMNNASGLKNMSAVARLTGAAGYTVTAETDIPAVCREINGYLSNLAAYDIVIPDDLKDGSIRRVVLNGGGTETGFDVRMPMKLKQTQQTSVNVSESVTEESTRITEPVPDTESKTDDNSTVVIVVIASAAVIVLLIAVFTSIILRNKDKSRTDKVVEKKEESPVDDKTSAKTEYIRPSDMINDDSPPTEMILPKITLKIDDIDSKKLLFEGSLENSDLTISREKKPDIKGQLLIINDKSVSRPHCRLYKSGGDVYVVNESSTNPLHVNGKKAEEPTRLPDGAVLRLGNVHLRISIN